jgi:hypothetical protein
MAGTRKGAHNQLTEQRLTRLERRLGNVQAGIEELHALVRHFAPSPRPELRVVKGGDDAS